MATVTEEESFHTLFQTLSTKLAAVSSNSKFMKTQHTELESLSSCLKEIVSLLPNGENVTERQSKELRDIYCEVDDILRLFSRKRYHHKIENELKAINTKLAKSLKKLRLINLYNPEHDIENILKEEELFYTALQTTNTKLALFSSDSELKGPCCVNMEIETLTNCIAEVVPLLHKCNSDTDKQRKHILFLELSFVFSNINKTLQLYQSKNCDENLIASQLRLINKKATKSLEKFQLVNLYTYNPKNDIAKMRVSETSVEEEIGYKPYINKLVESLEEEDCFFTILQDLSMKLTSLISSNAKELRGNIIGEIKSLFIFVEEMKSLFAVAEKDNPSKGDNLQAHRDELSELFCEIDNNLQLSSLKRGSNQIAIDLRIIRIKLGKILKKMRSTSVNIKTGYDITEMKISNSPVRALTVSGKHDEKEKIIQLLFSYKDTPLREPCLVPVVLKNGENPTKFCENLVEDSRVKNHFQRLIWVDAERHIDHEKIYRLVQRKQCTLFWVYKTIKDGLEECGLLVIDGIKKVRLDPFYRRVDEAGDRTSINDKRVTKIITVKSKRLLPWVPTFQKLSLEEAWKVVVKRCKCDNFDLEFEEIGRNILGKVDKWKTNGAMIDTLAFIFMKVEPKHWKMILESAFWKLPFYDENLTAIVLQSCYKNYYSRSTAFQGSLDYVQVKRC